MSDKVPRFFILRQSACNQGLVAIQFTTSVRKYELWRQTFHLQPPFRHRPAPSPPLLCSKYNCDLWMPSLLVNCFNTAATSLLTTMTKSIYLGLVFLVYIVSECIIWELLDIISNFWATGFAGILCATLPARMIVAHRESGPGIPSKPCSSKVTNYI